MKKVLLPSGKELSITEAPFSDAKDLYQAVAEELKGVEADPTQEIDANLIKDMACTLVSSKKVENALNKCMTRVLYAGAKIGPDTFEPVENREDYLIVCYEVAWSNIQPFMKSLYAKFLAALEIVKGSQA
jgi:hypothetical protein